MVMMMIVMIMIMMMMLMVVVVVMMSNDYSGGIDGDNPVKQVKAKLTMVVMMLKDNGCSVPMVIMMKSK